MQVHRNIDHLPFFRRAVITIGTFDGVHTGHQQLIQQLKDQAARIDGETVLITFHPHPRKIVKGHSGEIRLINTLEEKIGLLAWKNVDHLVIVPFTEVFSQLTAEQYVKEFLQEKFHPHTIIIGYDHQFGKGRLGNYRLLEELSVSEGYELQEIPVHVSNTLSVSSTRIREAILAGDMVTANRLLGYEFFFSGIVMEGDRLGRTIGYPTANLKIGDTEKCIPGDGVYAVEAVIVSEEWAAAHEGTTMGNATTTGNGTTSDNGMPPGTGFSARKNARLRGMMNIGVRPTVDGTRKVIEVNLFDFNASIYGQELRVYPKKYLRGEQKFAGLDALKEQLSKDKANTEAYFTATP